MSIIGWKVSKSTCLKNHLIGVLMPISRVSSSFIWICLLWNWMIRANDNSVIRMAENVQIKRLTANLFNNTSFLWTRWMWISASFHILIYIVVEGLKLSKDAIVICDLKLGNMLYSLCMNFYRIRNRSLVWNLQVPVNSYHLFSAICGMRIASCLL